MSRPLSLLPLSLWAVALVATLASAQEGPMPVGLAGSSAVVETIKQRDDAGRVRVAREVRQNDAGDFVNHGTWRSWDADGQLIGQGRYAWGEPTGSWSRWATTDDSPLLSTRPFDQFAGPFLSQASYVDGKLDGRWSIFDADGLLVSEIHFRQGSRHGEAVLKTPDGEIFSRRRFDNGLPAGNVEQRSDTGALQITATYEAGRRKMTRTEHYESQARKSRESWLGAITQVVQPDDPWRLRLARFETSGTELRHGLREAWWPNGQRKLRAEYRLGQAVGTARWWHENGQLALEGAYEEGLAAGKWSWWRENGVRAATCRYDGAGAEDWSMWAADGRRVTTEPTEQLARQPGATPR